MSQTLETPRGLDSLSADDLKLMESMRDDSPAPELAAPATTNAEPEEFEIELPGDPEPAPVTRAPRTEMVPHAQFHAAREEAKTAKKLAAEETTARVAAETKLATETAIAQERLNTLFALANAPTAAPAPQAPVAEDPLPDENTDPIGYFKAVTSRQAKLLEAQGGMLRGFQEEQTRARAVQELRNWGSAQETSFMSQEPAYTEAMTFLRKNRDEELIDLGITDPSVRAATINDDVTRIAQAARRDGGNFAERLFKNAVKRGFAKAAPETPTERVIPPLDADLPPEVAARATRIQEGRDNATTIGSLGAAPPARLSVARIAEMSESEFEALTTRLRAAGGTALRDLMGH